MFLLDAITETGRWCLFTLLPFMIGVWLLLLPVWLVWAIIHQRRIHAWRRWMEQAYSEVLILGESWSLHGPAELTSALCDIVWLLYWHTVCVRERVPGLRWEVRRGETAAEYEGRMHFRFAVFAPCYHRDRPCAPSR